MSSSSMASIVIVALVCGSCGSASTDVLLDSYPSDFPVTVSSGTTPTISWTGGPAVSLSVEEYVGGLIDAYHWYFFTDRVNGTFASPVTYGRMPTGSACGIASGSGYCPTAKPLQKGRTYLVMVLRQDFGYTTGTKIFRP